MPNLIKMFKRKMHWMIFLGFIVVLISSCSNLGDDLIQGKWARGDVHFWEEWNFSQGDYLHIYDDTHLHIQETGHYIVLETGENYVLIELIDQIGGIQSIEERVEMKIVFDPETDSIRLRRGNFTRVFESTLKDLATQQAPRE